MKLPYQTHLVAIAFVISCNQTKFRSDSGHKEPKPEVPSLKEEPPAPQPPPQDKCDLAKDFVPMQFPEHIQKCIDGGFIYDFYRNTCSPVPKATSYDCSFEGVRAKAISLIVDPAPIDQAIATKAKLIGCGEKRGGLTAVTEWWVPDTTGVQTDCSFQAGSVITVYCFQKENGDDTLVKSDDPEVKKQIIRKCLE